MQINLETTDKHSIQAYGDKEIMIDSIAYHNNLIISSHELITDWPINTIQDLNEELLAPLFRYQPKIIILGHNQKGRFAPLPIIELLSKQRIGLESMDIGAACRTFNVLLGEQRDVVLGIIF